MATSKPLLSSSESTYYNFASEQNNRKGCWSKICWLLAQLYHYTIGSCCYTPLRQLYIKLCLDCCKCCCTNRKKEETPYYELPKLPENVQDNKWKRASRIDEADRKMKEMLHYHFQDHIQKWTNRKHRRFPWKLVLHLLLVVSVTAQVSIYAHDKFQLTSFLVHHSEAFHQYFVRRECDCSEAVDILYTLDDIYKQIDYVANSYYELSQQAISSLGYINNNMESEYAPTLTMKLSYREPSRCFNKLLDTFPFENNSDTFTWYMNLFPLTTYPVDLVCDNVTSGCCSLEYCDRSIANQIKYFINRDNIKMIRSITFKFSLATVYQEYDVEDYNSVDAKFFITVSLKNIMHGSSMSVDVTFHRDPQLRRQCRSFRKKSTIVDIIVMTLLILSSWTYIMSIIKSIKLAKDVKLHFLAYHEKQLRWHEINPLFNKWFILMLFTDLLILLAIACKAVSEYVEYIPIRLVQVASILLGVGVFLLWCGLFGILSYFESLNVLLITVQLAFPSILRFAICIMILFIAFAFCGWLVIGPYHPKFKGFFVTVESLFCILNGDDLYGTFEGIKAHFTLTTTVRLFSKVYLALFIFLFIYIVLSLFIGIFNHAYESLSDNWRQRSRGFLRDWAEGEPEDDPSKNYPFPVPAIRKSASDPSIMIDNYEDPYVSHTNKKELPVPPVTLTIPEVTVSAPDHTTDTEENEYCYVDPHTVNVRTPQSNAGSNEAVLRKRHTSHLVTCGRLARVKSIVAEPPIARREEVAKARHKLQPNNPSTKVDMEETDV